MILVTGGTGLVGGHLLLHLLQKNEALRAIHRSTSSLDKTRNLFRNENKLHLFDQIEWLEADINDIPALEKAFQGIEIVYHCAALISFDPDDEEALRKNNIEGTANMINCALDFGVKKFCYVSSIAALGDAREGESVITEETEWNPEKNHSDYALSKFGAEMEVWRGNQEGLSTVIVNPGVIFGKGYGNSGSGILLQKIYSGFPFYSKGIVGIVAVEDVVQLMTELVQKPISGERFTLVAENLSLETITTLISKAMNKRKPFIHANPLFTSIAWRMDWLLSKILFRKRRFTRATSKSSHSKISYDNSKISNLLDYRFKSMDDYLTDVSKAFVNDLPFN